MSVKFFGQFLLQRNVITAEQLLEAVRFQEDNNMKFGDYLRARSYLKDVDIRRLNEEQKRTDLRIGELAVKMGMLTRQQVDEIVTMQKNDHMFIGEALVKKGFIGHEALVKELELFREDQREYLPGQISVPDAIKDQETVRDFVDMTQKFVRRVAHLELKVGVGHMAEGEFPRAYSVVSIGFKGGVNCTYVLWAGRDEATRITAGVIGEDDASGESENMLQDGVKEFANIVCGNIMAKLAKRGRTVDITPPVLEVYHQDGYNVIKGGRAVVFDMPYTGGEMKLMAVEN